MSTQSGGEEMKQSDDDQIKSNVNDNNSKNNCGRAARRRKRKIRDIRQAVQNLLHHDGGNRKDTLTSEDFSSGNTTDDKDRNDNSPSSSLPTDRSRSLAGVILRRKQLNKKDMSNSSSSSSSSSSLCSPKIEEDAKSSDIDHGFSMKDKSMLTSQLGFIPGNGISIVSRVNDIQSLYPNLYHLLSKPILSDHSIPDDEMKKSETSLYPMVLQLYPLVARDVYHGGKSDGRKFKSRKRGNTQSSSPLSLSSSVTNEEKNISSMTTENSTKDKNDNDTKSYKNDNDQKESDHQNNAKKNNNLQSEMTIEPFPTMFWLTHPHLKALISQLEIEPTHNVKTMEDKIQASSEYLHLMSEAHKSYGKQRWELLTTDDKKEMMERRWTNALGEERGVAGIRKFEHVKCLHAHAAHYLAYCGFMHRHKGGNNEDDTDISIHDSFVENLVGKWVLEAVEELILNDGRVLASNEDDNM